MSEALDKLLESPRLWRGQATSRAWQGLATGYPRLDEHLPGGGWPRHALTEILLGRYGSGELEVLMPALAALSHDERRDERHDERRDGDAAATDTAAGWLAWVAPPFQPYPPALAQWGIELSRVLIVRPREATEALWAAEQALVSGNCAAVLLWSRDLDATASRRLQLAAESGRSWAVAFRPDRERRRPSAAALRLELRPGAQGTDIHILKNRGGRPAAVPGIIHDYASLPGN